MSTKGNYAVTIYADQAGCVYSASETDQWQTPALERTVHGRIVCYAGVWYASQMPYRPYRDAVATAQYRAQRHRHTAIDHD